MLLVATLKDETKSPSVVGFLTNCVFAMLHVAHIPRIMCRSFWLLIVEDHLFASFVDTLLSTASLSFLE